MKIKSLFTEFTTLSYYPSQKPKQTRDIGIKPYMILRTSPAGWNVLNFYNGTSIYLPWSLLDIFISLNIWGGHRILRIEPEDTVEKTITQFLILVGTVERRDMGKFLLTLGDILKTKTTKFREWYEGERLLYPVEINSLDTYRTI